VRSFDDWGLPRSTGNIDADRAAALLAERTATTSAQRAAVALRLADIRAREACGAKSPEWAGPTASMLRVGYPGKAQRGGPTFGW